MMHPWSTVVQEGVPQDALLRTHRGTIHPERWGRYGDCFRVGVEQTVTLADYVAAFYTSRLFKAERLLLRLILGVRSSDADVRALARGSATRFAVWYVGERSATQLLMCDRYERTRSWFQAMPKQGGGTLLRFGSAVAAADEGTPKARSRAGRMLFVFHRLYSQMLLSAAKAALVKGHSGALP